MACASELLWHQWCHLAITQGLVSDSKCSWSAAIIPKVTCRSKPNASGRIQDHSAASNYWRPAPVTEYWPRLCHPAEITWPFLAVCLTVFLVEFWPRTFTIKLYRKKPTRSEIIILGCSFPSKCAVWPIWALSLRIEATTLLAGVRICVSQRQSMRIVLCFALQMKLLLQRQQTLVIVEEKRKNLSPRVTLIQGIHHLLFSTFTICCLTFFNHCQKDWRHETILPKRKKKSSFVMQLSHFFFILFSFSGNRTPFDQKLHQAKDAVGLQYVIHAVAILFWPPMTEKIPVLMMILAWSSWLLIKRPFDLIKLGATHAESSSENNAAGVHACVRVCMCHNEKKVPDEWQARQATPAILQVSSSKHNAKKITTRVRGPFHQSITAILTEEKREEKQSTKPTHVAVYLFRDLDRDRSRL